MRAQQPRELHLQLEQAPLFGDTEELYYFYVEVEVGSQRQSQTLIVDTGSHMTGFPCEPFCTYCGTHLNSRFNSSASSTSELLSCSQEKEEGRRCSACKDDQCTYTVSYMEGSSYRGIFLRDQVIFGTGSEGAPQSSSPVLFQFGCHRTETNLFYTQKADGIMGLGKPNSYEPVSLPTAAFQQGVVDRHLFALCLGHNGGFFSIGGFNSSSLQQQPVFLNYSGGSLYMLQLTQIELWDTEISADYYAIVDSGTTLVQMPEKPFNSLKSALQDFCELSPDFCQG